MTSLRDREEEVKEKSNETTPANTVGRRIRAFFSPDNARSDTGNLTRENQEKSEIEMDENNINCQTNHRPMQKTDDTNQLPPKSLSDDYPRPPFNYPTDILLRTQPLSKSTSALSEKPKSVRIQTPEEEEEGREQR